MESSNESMRDRLLSRLPQPANLGDYRKEVASLLEKNEKRLRREKLGVGAIWFFMVGLSTVLLWFGGEAIGTPRAAWFGTVACVLLIFGAVELLKHFINRSRVELLKEIKHVQLQVLQLHVSARREDA